jgi:hypothetical protein
MSHLERLAGFHEIVTAGFLLEKREEDGVIGPRKKDVVHRRKVRKIH